jgi:hypothetical protein
MVVPENIVTCVNEADVDTVVAWLDAGGDVNEPVSEDNPMFSGDTLLMAIPQSESVTDVSSQHVELAKVLLQRGADVNFEHVEDGYSALHCCLEELFCPTHDTISARAAILEILGIYLAAGATVNHKNLRGDTPLGMALRLRSWALEEQRHLAFESVKLLLRAGASLDACSKDTTAEEMLRRVDEVQSYHTEDGHFIDEHFIACRAIVADVRAAGSWKAYARAPPKALLRLRSLVARGRARSVKRLIARTPREIELLLAPAFPNELCWRVLEYWNPRA